MAYVSGKRTASITIGARLGEMVEEATAALAAWRLYRRTMNELGDLSARELADLGLTRDTIRQAAQDAVYGKAP